MKKALKNEMLVKRECLPKSEVLSKSAEIKERLFSQEEFLDSNVIMFYVSTKCEVFTHDMIKEALEHKIIAVPVVDVAGKGIFASEIENFGELSPGAFGILEPRSEFIRKIQPADLDIVVVPGVAFDGCGYRLGYGRGYYDMFLKKTNALKIGLAFEFQLIEEIPKEAHDMPMDKIITEKRIMECIKK